MGSWKNLVAIVSMAVVGGVGACSAGLSGSDESDGFGGAGEGFGGYQGTTTTTPNGTTTTTWTGTYSGTTTSTTWGGGGGGAGEPAPPPPAPIPGDAGTDAEAPMGCGDLDQSKPLVLYLSADDSGSMASPAHARELLMQHDAPYAIRTYEFLNYYKIDYPAPPSGQLAIFAAGEAGAEDGAIDMQIGVRSFDPILPRRPMTITFVLDTSGSMSGEPMSRERAVVKAIAASMKAGDVANMVTWSDSQSVLLSGYTVTGPNDPELITIANSLSANGGTNLSAGLKKGYDLAKLHYGPARLNRVILVSDGGANVGVTDEELIAVNSKDADQEGIYLVGVGAGHAQGYNDLLMDVVTDKGRGAYVYIDSVDEATAMFTQRFDEVMEIAARGVQVQLTLPWYFRMAKFYGEEYSTEPIEIEPQHLAPGDAMIFNQVLKACDPAMINGQDTIKVRANWQVPLTYASATTEITLTVDQLLANDKAALHKGKAIVAYAETLKTGLPADLQAAYDALVAANPGGADAELTELAQLVQMHPNHP